MMTNEQISKVADAIFDRLKLNETDDKTALKRKIVVEMYFTSIQAMLTLTTSGADPYDVVEMLRTTADSIELIMKEIK